MKKAAEVALRLNKLLVLSGLQGRLYNGVKYDGEQFWFLANWKMDAGRVELYLYAGPYFGKNRVWVGFGAKSLKIIEAVKAPIKSNTVTSIGLLEWDDDWRLRSAEKNTKLQSKAFIAHEDYSSALKLWAWFGKFLSIKGDQVNEGFSFLRDIMERHPPLDQSDDWEGATDGVSSKKIRLQQQRFKRNVMASWKNQCAVTRCKLAGLLEAAHIQTYAEKTDAKARTSSDNEILLLPHLHQLFDLGLISFSSDGQLLICDLLQPADCKQLGLKAGRKISQPFTNAQKNSMRAHQRNGVFLSDEKHGLSVEKFIK